MGGPGSGRRNAPRAGGRFTEDMSNMSRAYLEPWRLRCLVVGDDPQADAIATELATRTWQNVNPYADWLPVVTPSA